MTWEPTETERAIMTRAINRYGIHAQTAKAAEEHAEAAAAIIRYELKHSPRTKSGMAEELADAEIMREQLYMIYPDLAGAVSEQRARKLAALDMRTTFSTTPA